MGDALILAGARLTVLDLSDNAFGPDGVKGIETLLKSPTCYALQELRLNNCGMGIGGGEVSQEKVSGVSHPAASLQPRANITLSRGRRGLVSLKDEPPRPPVESNSTVFQ